MFSICFWSRFRTQFLALFFKPLLEQFLQYHEVHLCTKWIHRQQENTLRTSIRRSIMTTSLIGCWSKSGAITALTPHGLFWIPKQKLEPPGTNMSADFLSSVSYDVGLPKRWNVDLQPVCHPLYLSVVFMLRLTSTCFHSLEPRYLECVREEMSQ